MYVNVRVPLRTYSDAEVCSVCLRVRVRSWCRGNHGGGSDQERNSVLVFLSPLFRSMQPQAVSQGRFHSFYACFLTLPIIVLLRSAAS